MKKKTELNDQQKQRAYVLYKRKESIETIAIKLNCTEKAVRDALGMKFF
ncbi:TPA: hypothetical protein RQK38_000522 [Vibrio vulnificus]|nr:hypothetical protein [Vibrio vulnificus]